MKLSLLHRFTFNFSYEAPKPKDTSKCKNGSRNSLARNSNNSHNYNGMNPRSASGTPSPPLVPVRTSSNVGATTPLLNGHTKVDDIERITVEDNRSKFAIYSLPNKPRKVSRERKSSNDVTPMALSKVMPLLISNGQHVEENGNDDSSNNSNEEYGLIRTNNNGLPPQYPNRAAKQMHKLKASNNFVPDYNKHNGSHDSPTDPITNGDGASKPNNDGSSSVPRRNKHRRGKKSINDNYCVDSDIEQHILYGKETTL